MTPIRVLHLITDLDVGGAEMMLARLVGAADRRRFVMSVVSMVATGKLGTEMESRGVAVHSLNLRRGTLDLRGVFRLVRLLRHERVDVLQTWLYHADLLGLLAARLAGVPHLVWNLRCSNMNMALYSRLSAALPRLLARLSRIPDAVIVNSEAGRREHKRLGYRPRHWEILPNGIDIERFRPDSAARERIRAEFGLPAKAFLVCLPARVDPMKDHSTFLAAAARFARDIPAAHFLLVGRGAEACNATLRPLLEESSCRDRILLGGERDDMPAILAAADVVNLSSSFGEGFPNVVAEAMACGAPVVSTDVGDAAEIIDAAGIIVPVRASDAMASAWRRLYDEGATARSKMGLAARRRIIDCYALQSIVTRYEKLYEAMSCAKL